MKIVDVNPKNITQYPKGTACFSNPKQEGHLKKLVWLKKRFQEGLKIKIAYDEKNKKVIGFIEYVPGEYAWRAVDAKGYLFIHCVWIYGKTNRQKGYGSLLVQEAIKEAKKAGKNGVAVVVTDGPFMADKRLFEKNGFKLIAESEPAYELMVKTQKKAPLPKLKDWAKQLKKYQGLNLIYSNQCPWVARSIKDLSDIAKKKKVKLKVVELKTAKEAQKAPSIYAVFNLVHNGKLLVDHYISPRRFENVLRKEKLVR